MRHSLSLVTVVASAFAAAITLNAASCSLGEPASPSISGPGGGGGGGLAGDGAAGGDAGVGSPPFFADSANVYVPKVKNLLVGLPPTDQELQAVEADPTALGALVDGWMQLPEYQTKMLHFFELAFQQTQINSQDFNNFGDLTLSGPLIQNVQESFARTMLQISASEQPFTQAMNTQSYMMTTELKMFYAALDAYQLDDKGDFYDAFTAANPTLKMYVTAAGPIPLSETLDPTSPNYMHWYNPAVANLGQGILNGQTSFVAACKTDPIILDASVPVLEALLFGSILSHGLANGTDCLGASSSNGKQLQPTDFSDWTMVTLRPPATGEATSAFYDLGALRTATELVLKTPHVGFFTTPAFWANWQTNQSNQMRVTMNQTFIVATGAQVDGTDSTIPSSTPGLDAAHAAPGTACYGCHQLLDPSRSIFAATYSWNYGAQRDPTYANQPGLFAFEGVQVPVKTIADLGNTLASHPLVAPGWAEKLCYYVNSEACAPTDPVYLAIVKLFQTSGYSWNQLVKAVVTSPITTHTSATQTATTNGEVVSVLRRDHLCAAWNARLGLADYCGLDVTQPPVASQSTLAIVSGLPSDGYARGSIAPVMANQPSLFFRGATENVCESLAALVIDNNNAPAGAKKWSSASPDAAIADFVTIIIGLPSSDPRADPMQQILQSHFTAARQVQGMTATAALESTFTMACMAPSAISMGM